jgi:hypothetical protein
MVLKRYLFTAAIASFAVPFILESASVFADEKSPSVSVSAYVPAYPSTSKDEHFKENIERNKQRVAGVCAPAYLNDIRQSLYLNIPSYTLRLDNTLEGRVCSSFTYTVRVGRHWSSHTDGVKGSMETPVGLSKVIIKNFNIRLGNSPFTNTYDPDGNRVRLPMPHRWMRSLMLATRPVRSSEVVTRCVIHSTTEAHTVGTPKSHCCIGLRIEDMLDLYGLVVPEQKTGSITRDRQVPLTLDYRVVEREADSLILHADVYEKRQDYSAIILQELVRAGHDEDSIDHTQIASLVESAKMQFDSAYLDIRRKLAADEFVSYEDKSRLHYSIEISDLLR